MHTPMRLTSIVLASVSLAAALIAGCATSPEPVTTTTTTTTVSSTPPNVVTYPTGRYQLYGDGSATPYYWVWIPTGAVAPAPPPMPRPNVVTYNEGRYQLYGDGTVTPYYWVWVPAGSTVPAPPPPPPPRR